MKTFSTDAESYKKLVDIVLGQHFTIANMNLLELLKTVAIELFIMSEDDIVEAGIDVSASSN